jgi:hypothetical protein
MVFFLPIVSKTHALDNLVEENRSSYGLLLEPNGAKNRRFRRVGWLATEQEAYTFVFQALNSSRPEQKYFAGNKGDEFYGIEII